MTSSYRGVYFLGAEGVPTDIQVVDSGGNSIPLPIDQYVSRGVLPLWVDLPTEKQYKALLSVHSTGEGVFSFINVADAEECVERGWLNPISPNCWQLTDAGKKYL